MHYMYLFLQLCKQNIVMKSFFFSTFCFDGYTIHLEGPHIKHLDWPHVNLFQNIIYKDHT